MSKKSDWMSEEGGIPHKNGMVRFYLLGLKKMCTAILDGLT
jgi:hypothetical protein